MELFPQGKELCGSGHCPQSPRELLQCTEWPQGQSQDLISIFWLSTASTAVTTHPKIQWLKTTMYHCVLWFCGLMELRWEVLPCVSSMVIVGYLVGCCLLKAQQAQQLEVQVGHSRGWWPMLAAGWEFSWGC